MSDDEETVATLHVDTAPFPQTITAPCCGEEMTVYISERTSAVTCHNGCGWIEYIHDRQRGAESDDSTEQTELITDGGESGEAEQYEPDPCVKHRCARCHRVFDSVMNGSTCPVCGGASVCSIHDGGVAHERHTYRRGAPGGTEVLVPPRPGQCGRRTSRRRKTGRDGAGSVGRVRLPDLSS